MKKLLTAAMISVALIAASTTANAAAKPTPVAKSGIKKPAASAAEGTSTHEATEGVSTQKTEKKTAGKTKPSKVKTLAPVTKKKA